MTDALAEVAPRLLERRARPRPSLHAQEIASHTSLPHFEPTAIVMCMRPRSVASFGRGRIQNGIYLGEPSHGLSHAISHDQAATPDPVARFRDDRAPR
jgi:hypothetical protein